MPKRKVVLFAGLGAATDNPRALISRAVRRFRAAETNRKTDFLEVREAAEMGWLALSSFADVVAARLGEAEPHSYGARHNVLRRFETAYEQRGLVAKRLEDARTELHGDCFHADKCDVTRVGDSLHDIERAIDAGMNALEAPRARRRK